MFTSHQKNLIGIALFLIVLIVVWIVLFRRMKQQYTAPQDIDVQFNRVVNSLSARERTDEELIRASVDLDFPYTICYYADTNDPSRWIDTPSSVSAGSSILRRTKPFVVRLDEGCTGSTTIQYDFRTNASTINDSMNRRVDEIIKLFLQSIYPKIIIQEDTLIKNLTYNDSTRTYFLSVMVAYYDTTSQQYDVLINQFTLNSIGRLVNDPPQSLNSFSGSFNQIVRSGTTQIVNEPLRFIFLSAKGNENPRISIFLKTLYADRLVTVELNPTTTTYTLKQLPPRTDRLFLNVEGNGDRLKTKVTIDSFFSIIITPNSMGTSSSFTKINHKFVIFKLFTFNPLTTAIYTVYRENYQMNAYFRPRETEIRQGILRIYNLIPAPNAPYYSSTEFQNLFKAMNNGDMNGMYIVPQLTSDKMNCAYYTKAEGQTWLSLYNDYKNSGGTILDPRDPDSKTRISGAYLYWQAIFLYAFTDLITYPTARWKYALKYYARNGGDSNVTNPRVIEYGTGISDEDNQCQSIALGESFNN